MGAFILKRALTLIPVWIGITFLAFVLIHSIPGGPFDNGTLRSADATEFLRRFYNLDEPLWKQYLLYMSDLVHGDFGESMVRPGLYVSDLITERFPTSFLLGAAGVTVSLLVGIPAGIVGAVKQNTWIDHSVMVGATIGYAIPNFVLSLILILVFGGWLGWFPLGGWGGIEHIVLPALALGLPWSGLIARLTRASMLEVLRQDYIRTAQAKGASPRENAPRSRAPKRLHPADRSHRGARRRARHRQPHRRKVIFGIPGIGPVHDRQRPRGGLHADTRPERCSSHADLYRRLPRRHRLRGARARGAG